MPFFIPADRRRSAIVTPFKFGEAQHATRLYAPSETYTEMDVLLVLFVDVPLACMISVGCVLSLPTFPAMATTV